MATLKEVAQLAGVAPITVSRVVNCPDTVKEKTRLKVEAAMRELKYTPNIAAKSLATNRCGVIDVYIPESIALSNPFVMYFIAGISSVLSEHYYSFLILRNRKREHLCDGYIVTGLLKNEIREFAQYASERNRPVVLFGHSDIPQVDCLDVDNLAGAKCGVEHLIAQGHKKIAMINVLEDKDYTVDRLEGYRQALESNGLDYDPGLVLYTPNSVAGGEMAAREIIQMQGITAVFCATDTIAIGVASQLKAHGYAIPGDISLLGFDGLGHDNAVLEVAAKLKAQGIKMFASWQDIFNMQFSNRQAPWVVDDKLIIDENMLSFMDTAKTISDNGYDLGVDPWAPEWTAAMESDDTFCYVLPSWGYQFVVKPGAVTTNGQWAMCQGAVPYVKGGTWLGIYKDSPNKDLAWAFLSYCCLNSQAQQSYAAQYGEYVSLKSADAALAEGEGEAVLGGQNPFAFYNGQMEKLPADLMTGYDGTISNAFLSATKNYATGAMTKDEAIAQFKADVANAYPELTIE